jgi:hypothetical protein
MNVSSSRGKWVGRPTTPSTYSGGARDDQQASGSVHAPFLANLRTPSPVPDILTCTQTLSGRRLFPIFETCLPTGKIPRRPAIGKAILNQATQHWYTGSTRKRVISVFP